MAAWQELEEIWGEATLYGLWGKGGHLGDLPKKCHTDGSAFNFSINPLVPLHVSTLAKREKLEWSRAFGTFYFNLHKFLLKVHVILTISSLMSQTLVKSFNNLLSWNIRSSLNKLSLWYNTCCIEIKYKTCHIEIMKYTVLS